ncbi:MAG: 3D domain-containing protein [Kiritimatiellae bacterium]|nr:3D domain-containing protein [Kiritimatiellia bacterium]
MKKRKKRNPIDFLLPVAVALFLVLAVLAVREIRRRYFPPPLPPPGADEMDILATGYCNCGICCSWTTNAQGKAVYSYGKMKGKPKIVGRTCSGTTAHRGTIAADPKLFKFGTRLEVPGYGEGVVEDVGGAIKGDHIDLWFPTHEEARQWGRRKVRIRIL